MSKKLLVKGLKFWFLFRLTSEKEPLVARAWFRVGISIALFLEHFNEDRFRLDALDRVQVENTQLTPGVNVERISWEQILSISLENRKKNIIVSVLFSTLVFKWFKPILDNNIIFEKKNFYNR